MLSSFGFDKGAARTAARNNSKYVLEVPRGFSVHVFKQSPPPSSGFPSVGKPDYPQNRDAAGLGRTKPIYTSRPEPERKPPSTLVEPRSSQLSAYARVFEPKQSKQPRSYGIYPTAIPDTYIYERSVSSVSDVLSSDSSSDSDSIGADSAADFAFEMSSTRASSSTETLETTAVDTQTNVSAVPTPTPAPSGPLRSIAPAPSGLLRSTTPASAIALQPVSIRNTRSMSSGQSPVTSSRPSAPSRHATVEEVFDSDSETVISDGADPAVYATQTQPPPHGLGASLPLSTPIRRGSDDSSPRFSRPGTVPPRGASPLQPTQPSRQPSSASPSYDENILRAPPGLQPSSSTRSTPSRSSSGNSSKSQIIPGEISRTAPLAPLDTSCVYIPSAKRCVRWDDNLICPSPILASARRRGWYNRRGDQLWTNDGKFRSPEAGQEYPVDLSSYPEPSAGWMNEEGVRIDMQHRLIPKAPLRSALKRSPTQEHTQTINISPNL